MIVTVVLLMSFGCKTVQTERTDNTSLVVKAGYICGWGSGEDSITVSQKEIKYIYYIPRKSQQAQITKTRPTTDAEWSEISDAVNIENFVKLNYNTCNVCADGCDEWISIQKGKVSHKITFDKGAKIDSISKLQVQLAKLRAIFNPQ